MRRPLLAQPPRTTSNKTLPTVAASLAVTVLIILLAALVVGLDRRAAVGEASLVALAAQLNTTSNALLIMQASLYDAAMDVSALQSNTTVLSDGTFVVSSPSASTGTYTVRNVHVGPLNFTLLELALDAPLSLADYGSSTVYTVVINTFAPAIRLFSDANTLAQDLSAANVARLSFSVTGGSYQANEGTTTIKYVSTNSVVTFKVVAPAAAPTGDAELSFVEPLQLLIATV